MFDKQIRNSSNTSLNLCPSKSWFHSQEPSFMRRSHCRFVIAKNGNVERWRNKVSFSCNSIIFTLKFNRIFDRCKRNRFSWKFVTWIEKHIGAENRDLPGSYYEDCLNEISRRFLCLFHSYGLTLFGIMWMCLRLYGERLRKEFNGNGSDETSMELIKL